MASGLRRNLVFKALLNRPRKYPQAAAGKGRVRRPRMLETMDVVADFGQGLVLLKVRHARRHLCRSRSRMLLPRGAAKLCI